MIKINPEKIQKALKNQNDTINSMINHAKKNYFSDKLSDKTIEIICTKVDGLKTNLSNNTKLLKLIDLLIKEESEDKNV
jgi:hypothetical protein